MITFDSEQLRPVPSCKHAANVSHNRQLCLSGSTYLHSHTTLRSASHQLRQLTSSMLTAFTVRSSTTSEYLHRNANVSWL